ncbi:MAG TPA: CarD family transcriptional regulator, partial [Gaiellales bacterium]|nr:CarD family transcriptional regulator [Gaiellales bacterium]
MAEGTMQRPDAPLAGAELALPYLLDDADFASFARRAAAGATRARVSEPLLGALVAALWTARAGLEPRGLAVLVGDDDAARALCEAASAFLPGEPVAFMPSRGAAHGSGLDPAPHLAGERARALHALAAGGLVAVSADALVERVPPAASRPRAVELRLGEERSFDDLTHELADAGYERAHTVEERGQFSVRGGLVDVFPSTGREPVRAEFFGDSLERLSAFSGFTQRSLRDLDHVLIHAAAERAPTGSDPTVAWGVEEDEGAVPEGLVSPLPELAGAAALVAWNPDALAAEVEEAFAEAAELLRDPVALRRGYVPVAEARELIDDATALDEMPLGQPASFDARPPALASFGVAEAENELRSLERAGYRVLVCFPHLGEARRTHLQLRRVDVALPDPGAPGPEEAGVAFCVGQIRRGFVAPGLRLAVLPSGQLFRRRSSRGPARIGRALATVADLRPGDFVVHEDHGVGRFVRFDTKEVGGVVRDYLYLEFRGDD